MKPHATTDLCDAHENARVLEPGMRLFGGARAFAGAIATVVAPDDNTLVRAAVSEPGGGRVLVVDGGGSRRCALLGDNIAELARASGWAGVVVNGCVRDAAALARIEVGVAALATHPRKSAKGGAGKRDVPVTFGGVTFTPGEWIACDEDGVVVLASPPVS